MSRRSGRFEDGDYCQCLCHEPLARISHQGVCVCNGGTAYVDFAELELFENEDR